MIIEETEFKGRPTLTIRFNEDDRFPFSFGMGKAKKILGSLDEIRAFVEKYDKPREEPTQVPQPVPEPVPETDDAPVPDEAPGDQSEMDETLDKENTE